MRFLILIIVWMLSGASTSATQDDLQSLLTVGMFHGDEIRAESGEVWVGLFKSNDGFRLGRARLLVSKVYDPIVDESKEHPTGKQVFVDGQENAVFLFPSHLSLSDGPVVASHSEKEALDFNVPKSLALGKNTYDLLLILESTSAPNLGCRIVFRDGLSSQVLKYLEECDPDKWPALLWAGDLDRDGKLDLIIDQAGHYNVTELALYLSSKARNGALVAHAAYLRTTGC